MTYFERVLNIGIALSKETDYQQLLSYILEEAMSITKADAGTLYMCKNEYLEFKVIRNTTLGIYSTEGDIKFPPVPRKESNVCAYAAIHNQIINISDVYECEEFEFTGPRKYDEMSNYRTKSMLIVPLSNNQQQVIGVIQLINAKEKDEVVSFQDKAIKIVAFLASQSAITLTNERHTEEVKRLFYSFIEVLSTAIDERTPYNANHTRNLVSNMEKVISYINEEHLTNKKDRYIDRNKAEQLLVSGWLHDIGKIITPLEVMNKATRLEGKLDIILNRLDYIKSMAKIHCLEGNLTESELNDTYIQVEKVREHVQKCNTQGGLSEEERNYTREIAQYTFIDMDQKERHWLESDEVENLFIVNGTLTEIERKVMQQHVELTGKLLSKMNFESLFKEVPYLAQSHHECLDGTGYPNKLSGNDLNFEARLLAVMDIYEALSSADRPYKKAMEAEQIFAILDDLVGNNKIDGEIVEILKEMHSKNRL